jgi:hypothetical protein
MYYVQYEDVMRTFPVARLVKTKTIIMYYVQ